MHACSYSSRCRAPRSMCNWNSWATLELQAAPARPTDWLEARPVPKFRSWFSSENNMKPTQRGTAIVEFALVLPLLLLLTMTTTEFGRAIYQYNTIVKSLRDATRYLSTQTPNTKLTEAKNLR